MTRAKFVAAMKRRDVKELGAIILSEIYGEDEKAKELMDASRITTALIDRTCIASDETVVDTDTDETVVYTDTDTDTDEEDVEVTKDEDVEVTKDEGTKPELKDLLKDLEKAIAKGKKKKAKKLLAELEATGLKGSEMKNLAKQVKALK